ncbi:MAG: PEGA domain-containing protein [Blastocatellales bacterium]
MSISTHRVNVLLAALIIPLIAVSVLAQGRKLIDEDWYGDVKKALSDHYTGKKVRLKLPIPATRHGLEMVDGAVQREATKEAPQFSAQIGDELTIKYFKVSDSSVEVLLDKNEPPRKSRFPSLFGPRQPRISLQFSHELSSKDLTIENLNRFLSPAVDVTTLATTPAENNSNSAASSETPSQQPEPQPIQKSGQQSEGQKSEAAQAELNLPTPDIVADLPVVGPNVGEFTVECSVRGARVYIDGSYSGSAPRTLRLRAGFHTILVLSAGYENWERRLYIPGAKISVARAELQRN